MATGQASLSQCQHRKHSCLSRHHDPVEEGEYAGYQPQRGQHVAAVGVVTKAALR